MWVFLNYSTYTRTNEGIRILANYEKRQANILNCTILHVCTHLEEDLHPDEGLPPLLCEHVPGLRPSQQVRHASLKQSQMALSNYR